MILTLFAAIKIHELKFGALRAYIHSSGKGKFAPMTVRIWENCPNVFGASCWCAMFPGGRSGQRQAQVLCWELCGQGFLEDVPYNITKKWKKLFKKKREWLLYFQKRVMSAKRWRKRMAKNGVQFMAQCQVIADYKELVGTCADIPQSLQLSCIIWRPRGWLAIHQSCHSDGAETITFEVRFLFGKGTKSVRGIWKERSKQKRGHINR